MPKIPEAVVFDTDNRCYDLRRAGLNYRQIAKALGCSPARAYNGVQRVMRRIAAKQVEDGADVLRMEIDRLDGLLQQMWPMTMPHDVETEDGGKIRVPPSFDAVDRVLKIMDRRAKLLGLDQIQLSIRTNNNAGISPSGVKTGETGEITPADEARSLMKVMAEAGVLEMATVAAINAAMGGGGDANDVIDAIVVDEEQHALESGEPPEPEDGAPFYEGMPDEDESPY